MSRIFIVLIILAAFPAAAAQDIEFSKKEIKKQDGTISTEIVYGHLKNQKVYERWILFDTVSDKSPKPDTIERFYYGPSIPFEIRYHNGTRKFIFRSIDSLSVIANLEADEASRRSITFVDGKANMSIHWTIDEDGFYSKLTTEGIAP